MTCPHCGDAGLEKGATGLDLCTKCGGLSRAGRALRRNQEFQNFSAPQMTDLRYAQAEGSIVAAVILEDGSTGIAVTFVLGTGKSLPPIVLAGEQASNFGRLVADALRTAQRTTN